MYPLESSDVSVKNFRCFHRELPMFPPPTSNDRFQDGWIESSRPMSLDECKVESYKHKVDCTKQKARSMNGLCQNVVHETTTLY